MGIYKKVDGRTIKVAYFVMKYALYGEIFELIESQILSENLSKYIFHNIL